MKMKKHNLQTLKMTFGFMVLAVLLNSCSQLLCIKPGSDQLEGVKDGYRYELWNQYSKGQACMTLGKGALFSGEWKDVENYLSRRGLNYDKTLKHHEIGNFRAVYNCDYRPSREKGGNSYLSVYGWTVDPLVEFYIIEDWQNWIPSMAADAILKGTLSANGSIYDIYEYTRVNQPSIVGITTFRQYFSIRRDKRQNGTIDISEHFNKWESLGLQLGKMHEVSFVVEGYHNSGKFNFKELEITAEKINP